MKHFGPTAGETASRIASAVRRWDDRVIRTLRPRIFAALAVGALAAVAASCGGESESESESAVGAALPGLEWVRTFSPLDSQASKGTGPSCPSGKKLTGAGGRIDQFGTGKVGLDEITVYGAPSNVSVIGVEVGAGTSSNWSVRAYGYCETDTVEHRVELRKADSAIDSSTLKSATAVCSSGKKVLGASGQINVSGAGTGKVVLSSIAPSASSATATGVETGGGTSLNWYITAFAICGSEAAIPGLQLVSAPSANDSNAAKSVVAYCPSGKKATGGGGVITASAADKPSIVLEGVGLHGLSLDRVTAYGAETGAGTSNNWSVTSYVICATP
jgi:hypothetical protein